jgi:Ca2+-binding EF-hand superfamily protein
MSWSDRTRLLIESDKFEVTIGIVVMVNVVIIAADSEVRINGGDPSPETMHMIKSIDLGCLVVYTAELLLKIVVYGKELVNQLNGWTGVDAALVALGILGEIIESEVQMFLMLRIVKALRAFRILRAVRSLGFMKPLLMVLHDFGGMIKLLFGGFMILLVLVLVFALFGMEMFHGSVTELASEGAFDDFGGQDGPSAMAFSSMFRSFVTLFGVLTLDQWHEVVFPISLNLPHTLPFFLLFACVTTYGVVQLLAAAMVLVPEDWANKQNLLAAEQHIDRKDRVLSSLEDFFETLDFDGSGYITYQEFFHMSRENDQFMTLMHALDILDDDIDAAWHLLDINGDGQIDKKEFLDVMWRLQSEETKWTLLRTSSVTAKMSIKLDVLQRETEGGFKELTTMLKDQREALHSVLQQLGDANVVGIDSDWLVSQGLGSLKPAEKENSAKEKALKLRSGSRAGTAEINRDLTRSLEQDKKSDNDKR